VSVPAFAPIALVIGTLLAIVLTESALAWGTWIGRRARDLGLHTAVAAFLVHAYFTLSTQAHENHFFVAVPLLRHRGVAAPRVRAGADDAQRHLRAQPVSLLRRYRRAAAGDAHADGDRFDGARRDRQLRRARVARTAWARE